MAIRPHSTKTNGKPWFAVFYSQRFKTYLTHSERQYTLGIDTDRDLLADLNRLG